jgi:uncharacterized lipoprotein YddW (UPF0748 family)
MCRYRIVNLALCWAVCWCLSQSTVRADELRGFWVDAFHDGMKSAAQVTQLVADTKAGNFNALFVQVRKRGDAYYLNGLEPPATDISDTNYDPLQDLINKAHSGTPRIEVHAWIVTYNIWGSQGSNPKAPMHPYLLHPEWLTRKADGTTWDGKNYAFDPGHPEVQTHTYNVCMDIVSRYEIDGLHFDYIRYTDEGSTVGSQLFGYNAKAVERFQKLHNRTDTPAANDAQWLLFRRSQVTSLVRKVYLNAWKQRRAARISAALICYGAAPSSASTAAWQSSEAYGRVLQDWRSWLQEGILDLGVPMLYRDYSNATRASEWNNWSAYTRDNQANRAGAVGAGVYLNAIPGTISEIKISRIPNATGKTLAGVVAYSYAVYTKDTPLPSLTSFFKALKDDATAETYDPGGTPVFAAPVSVPPMPWKSSLTTGHAMGYVRAAGTGAAFDTVVVNLSGPVSRVLTTDATGFYGAVDLPVGSYTATVSLPGYFPVLQGLTVTGSEVTEWTANLVELPLTITQHSWNSGQRRITLTWNSRPLKTYRIDTSTTLDNWTALASAVTNTGYTTTWTSSTALPAADHRFFRVVLEN